MLLRRLGAAWELAKVTGLVLWPLRFIIVVNLAMLGIFCLDQAQDALFGAVVQRQNAFWVFAAVALWATQSWYWARLLLDLPPKGFTVNFYTSQACRTACYDFLRVVVPRFVGGAVFILVGVFIRVSAGYPESAHLCGWLWLGVYVAAAGVFYLLTTARRAFLNRGGDGADAPRMMTRVWRNGHSIAPVVHLAPAAPVVANAAPPLPVQIADALKVSRWFALLWLILLLLTMLTAFGSLSEAQRLVGSNLLIVVLALASVGTILALDYGRGTKFFLIFLIAVDGAVFLLSINWPAWFGMLCGPAVILMLVAAVWVGSTSFFLALPGHRLGLPVASLLIIGMVLFGAIPSWLNPLRGDHDNHAVRGTGGELPADRLSLLDAFERWKVCPPKDGQTSCVKNKLVIVAIEGGASRSAYWSSMILTALEDVVPDFHQSIFAISSVSGGSLGAAVYQRLIAAGNAGKPVCGKQASYMLCAASVLELDFLGADFLSMFNSDLLQRLLPGSLLPDRAYAIETAWEHAWRGTMQTDDFSQALHIRKNSDLTDPTKWLPVLLLNGSSVKTGHRIVTSDVAIDPACDQPSAVDQTGDPPWKMGAIPSAVDFFCLTRETIPLSTAVHNSARFPYISPAGTLWAKDSDGNSWKADRIVDGGYFEVLGGVTVTDLLAYLYDNDKLTGIDVTVLALENDPNDASPNCDPGFDCEARALAAKLGPEAETMSFALKNANDVLAPIIGLANSRTGRGDYAADALEVLVTSKKGPMKGNFVRINLLDDPAPGQIDPAMSWYLSPRSISDMQHDACISKTVESALDRLGTLLPSPIPTLASAVRKDLECDKHL